MNVQCDTTYSCPSGTTCCNFSGQWNCAQVGEDGVCCPDGQHACPKNYPVCNEQTGQCEGVPVKPDWGLASRIWRRIDKAMHEQAKSIKTGLSKPALTDKASQAVQTIKTELVQISNIKQQAKKWVILLAVLLTILIILTVVGLVKK